MIYKHAKDMLLTLKPEVALLVQRYRAGSLDDYYRTLVAPVVRILDDAERYVKKAEGALAAFTQRIVSYRGRDFTEVERAIYQETSLTMIDDIEWKHEGSSMMRVISREKRDYSMVIAIEQAFKAVIPDYVRPACCLINKCYRRAYSLPHNSCYRTEIKQGFEKYGKRNFYKNCR